MLVKERTSRPGFTLVEIIVVITILAVLFSLTAGAVMKAMDTANQGKISSEIMQIAAAVDTFKAKYGMCPPSQFLLMNQVDKYNVADPHQRYCKQVITTMFPRIRQDAPIGWCGDNNANSRLMLNGCESLVFFLGGRTIVSGGAVGSLGFTSNPANPWPDPSSPSVNMQKGDVFFAFDPARLKLSPFKATNPAAICVYLDGYASGQNDMPYFYFSSHKSGNDYGMFAATQPDIVSNWASAPAPFQSPPAPFRIAPLMNSQNMNPASPQNRFFNPNGFQLISAGKNKRIGNFQTLSTSPHRAGFVIFENGDFKTPPTPTADRMDEAGDNLCNFHDGKMGFPN